MSRSLAPSPVGLYVAVAVAAGLFACGGTGPGDGPPPTGKQWGESQVLDTLGEPVSNVRIAVDDAGNAIAIWQQLNPGPPAVQAVFARRLTKGMGWDVTPTLVSAADDARNPTIAMNGSGDAIVVWEQDVGIRKEIFAALYRVGTGWLVPTDVDASGATLSQTSPRPGIDGSGNAVVVWIQDSNVWSNFFLATGVGAGWQVAGVIEPDAAAAGAPHVAMNAGGQAVAVWVSGTSDIAAARFVPDQVTPWEPRELVDSLDGVAANPRVAIDPVGDAVAVWQQHDPAISRTTIQSNRLVTSVWEGPLRADGSNLGDASQPDVGMNSFGDAVAVWQQTSLVRTDVWANRLVSGAAAWAAAEVIEGENAGDATAARVQVNSPGEAVAVWQQADGGGTVRLWSNAFEPGSGWGEALRIVSDNTRTGESPQVGLDNSGDAVAAWLESAGALAATYD